MTTTVASVVTMAMFALVAGGAEAAPRAEASTPQQATAVQQAPAETVLSSQFGKAKSKVKGEFGKRGTVEGTFTPRRFRVRNGQLVAIGKLRATMIRGNGNVVGEATQRIRIPVRKANGESARVAAGDVAEGARMPAAAAAAAPGCDILNLVLGPLDLNLLGLEVHLNRVVLDIIAQPGPGNLLGNLLCAVAGLLDGTGFLRQVSQILNAVLGLLRA